MIASISLVLAAVEGSSSAAVLLIPRLADGSPPCYNQTPADYLIDATLTVDQFQVSESLAKARQGL